MKVLIINTVPTEKNGITGVIFNMLNNISFENLHVDYVAINTPDESYQNAIHQKGGEVFVIPRQFKHPLKYICKIAELQRKNGYDVIHAHGNSCTLILEMIAGLLGGCKYRIAHSHSTSCIHTTVHRVLKPLFNIVCNGRVACSQKAGIWLFGNKRFDVINNGVNLVDFQFSQQYREDIRNKYGLSEDHILLGHVGDFHTDNKNQAFLVDLLVDIKKTSDKYRLMLIGDGELRSSVEKKVNDLGLGEYVFFAGLVNNVNEYLSAFDIFLLPSKFEGVPLTVVEAQANGLSCILSKSISTAVDLTGRIVFADINNGLDVWKKEVIMNKLCTNRVADSDMSCNSISEKGYDLIKECEKLKMIYRRRNKI